MVVPPRVATKAAFCAFVALLWSPAYAIDCTKASTPVDKLICATPELIKADDEMSAAYFKLLHETTDSEFHLNLIQSQVRWLEQRSHGPQRYSLAVEQDKPDDREALVGMTHARRDFLQSGQPLRTMERQRAIMSKDGGGAFAGYGPGAYYRQRKDRVCGFETWWASGHVTDIRLVGVVKDDELKLRAMCSTNSYFDVAPPCPVDIGSGKFEADAHWNTAPKPSFLAWPPRPTLRKYDPDRDERDDVNNKEWMDECLVSETYPPADVSRADK